MSRVMSAQAVQLYDNRSCLNGTGVLGPLGSAWAGPLLTAHVCYCAGEQVHVLNTCPPMASGHMGPRVPASVPRTFKSSPVSDRHSVAGGHRSIHLLRGYKNTC